MATKTYNVGVIGYGLSAKVFHIPLILTTPRMKLYAIVQRSPKPNDSAAADHPDAIIYNSAEAMFADPAIDVIVISTIPETHFEFTATALKSGKHVVVEKPFVATSREADELVALSAQTGKFICVYQNRRWDSDFLTVRDLLEKDTLGRIVEYHTHFDRYRPVANSNTWKAQHTMDQANGIVYDLGTHLLDQAYVAFGMPATVMGFFANQRADGAPEPDCFTAILRYDAAGPHKELLVTATASVVSAAVHQPRFWVRGFKGSFTKQHLDVQEDQLRAGMKPGDAGFGVERADRAGTLVTADADGVLSEQKLPNVTPQTYGALYAKMVDAMDKNDPELVPVKASEAANVLRIIEAVRESATTGKLVSF